MLPLAIGMKVALTEHLDRPKNLLKGSVGRIHSWAWKENDRPAIGRVRQLPKC